MKDQTLKIDAAVFAALTHGTISNCETDLLTPIWKLWECGIVMWNWWVGISLKKLKIYIPCSDLTCMCNLLIKTIKYEFGYMKLMSIYRPNKVNLNVCDLH